MSDAQTDGLDQHDMARLAYGEDQALNDLMDRHAQRLFHYLVRLCQNETTAADFAQEAFVRVYQHRARFKLNESFGAWLYAIATNLWRDHQRRQARRPQVSLDAQAPETGTAYREFLPARGPTPPEALQARERAEMVRCAVAGLPEELRIPLILAEYDELSQAEIAAILKCTPKAVEMRIYRARQQLRAELTPLLLPS